MKVLIIPSWYHTDKASYTGIYVQEQALALQNQGEQVLLYYPGTSADQWTRRSMHKNTTDPFPSYYVKGFSLPKIQKRLIQRWVEYHIKQLERLIAKYGVPDIIHAHSFVAGILAAAFGDKYHKPYVLTEHYSGILKPNFVEKRKAILDMGWQAATQLMTVSPAMQAAIAPIYEDVTILPNLVDEEIFYPSETNKPCNPLQLLGVGTFSNNKGFAYLIEAVGKLKAEGHVVKLKLVGDGPKYKLLNRLVQRLQLTEEVEFTGVLSKQDTALAFRQADIFCLPSAYEPFGIVLIEALATGIPVIASGKGGPETLVNNSNGRLFPYGDVESLMQSILTIQQEYEIFIPTEIRKDCLALYGKSKIITEMQKVYRDAITEYA